jgi:nickel-dependent lactate racemase
MSTPSNVIRLKYGHDEVHIPRGTAAPIRLCVPHHRPGLRSVEDAVRGALHAPIESPALRDLAKGGRSAAILISARDRVTRSDVFTAIVADELNAAGIPDRDIQVFLATGTHQKQTEADIRSLVGPQAFERLRVVHHDPRDEGNLINLGVTSFGTPIFVNRAVYESDVKILTGRIAHHYFAGFSGGRKAIAPGVSGFKTILANHKRVMHPDGGGIHPRVEAGVLAGNPVHEDLLEIAKPVRPSFCLNTVLNTEHEITHIFAGDYLAAHEAGCRTVESLFRLQLDEPAEWVVASCGGWPYDMSFMQVIKTIVSASRAVADGGTLVVLGECERGLEPGFLEWFQYGSLGDLNRAVLDHYNLKGHNTYWLKEIQSRIQVVLVTRLPAADVAAMGFQPEDDPVEAINRRYRLNGSDPLIVPYGNITTFSSPGHHARSADAADSRAAARQAG